jgi:hypothetical protein
MMAVLSRDTPSIIICSRTSFSFNVLK